jgi:hypothetical protein
MATTARIPEREIAAIRDRAKIEEVIGSYVPLRFSAGVWKGLCPFHREETPSFQVTPSRGYWYCFGACAEGGDVVDFVRKIENLSFVEAVAWLADRFGIQPKEDPGAIPIETSPAQDDPWATPALDPLDSLGIEIGAVSAAIWGAHEKVVQLHHTLNKLRVSRDPGVITARLNNCFVREPCVLCGVWDRPGRVQFLLGHESGDNVCGGCAAEYAPDLYAAAERFGEAEHAAGCNPVERWPYVNEAVFAIFDPDGVFDLVHEAVTIEGLDAATEYLNNVATSNPTQQEEHINDRSHHVGPLPFWSSLVLGRLPH